MSIRVRWGIFAVLLAIGVYFSGTWYFGEHQLRGFAWLYSNDEFGWYNRPGNYQKFRVDESGMREVANRPTRSEGAVLCLGDSGTFGVCRLDDGTLSLDSWPDALQSKISGYAIYNAGTIGYNATQGLMQLRKFREPLAYVVARFGWNDHGFGWNTVGPLNVDDYAQALTDIVKEAQLRGAVAIILDYPVPTLRDGHPQTDALLMMQHANTIADIIERHKLYERAAERVANETGAVYVQTGLAEQDYTTQDAVHPNRQGVDKIARAVAEVLNETIASKRVASR